MSQGKCEIYKSRLTKQDLKGTSFTPRNVYAGTLFTERPEAQEKSEEVSGVENNSVKPVEIYQSRLNKKDLKGSGVFPRVDYEGTLFTYRPEASKKSEEVAQPVLQK